MCGIAAIVRKGAEVDRKDLMRMASTIRHRGPDDMGVWTSPDGSVGLGHTRLAVIDVSSAGHQPMESSDRRVRLVFNGEIYNFRALRAELQGRGRCFRSGTDTEVLLEGYGTWGDDVIDRLEGMFAFAIHDQDRRRILAARDRAGEKPLYYVYRPESGIFMLASEIKALLVSDDVPRAIDPLALDAYLAYGYVPGERSMLQHVRKLPAGHVLRYDIDRGNLEIERYWDLPDFEPRDVPEEVLVDRLEALLSDSVKSRLVADVQVGVMLSGGIDSGLVTGLAARASSRPVKTFTAAFPGRGRFDESGVARSLASHFGTDHTELVVEPATVDLLPKLARQYDEPLADSSMVPTYLISRLIREHATVALGGDGGDELFGGYFRHSWVQTQERWRGILPGPVRRAVAWGGKLLPTGFRGRNYAIGFGRGAAWSVSHANMFFDAGVRPRLSPVLRESDSGWAEAAHARVCPDRSTALQIATCTDFKTYLVDDILAKVDRASMLTSLEVRAPWLDHHLVEFAFGRVPDHLRATPGERKILPKMLARRMFPEGYDYDRKQGFSIPLSEWLEGEWGSFCREVLSGADPDILDVGEVFRLFKGQELGLSNPHRLFALTMFELWRREYQVSAG